MADSKITDLSTLTGANLATGDELPLVDVSDSTMAASGTDKSITADELAKGLATNLGVVGRDKLWDAAGDTVIGTGADTAARLAVSTSAGQALAADPNATNKLSWQYPLGLESASRGTSGSLASTYDRATAIEGNLSGLVSQRLQVVRILLPKGLSISNITFWSATTALATGTNQWFALFDSSRNKLAITADDTSTAWAANTAKTLAVTSGPYVTTTTGWFWLGIMVKATTVPTVAGIATLGNANIRNTAPFPQGIADTGLTNPASCPTQFASPTSVGGLFYAEVS